MGSGLAFEQPQAFSLVACAADPSWRNARPDPGLWAQSSAGRVARMSPRRASAALASDLKGSWNRRFSCHDEASCRPGPDLHARCCDRRCCSVVRESGRLRSRPMPVYATGLVQFGRPWRREQPQSRLVAARRLLVPARRGRARRRAFGSGWKDPHLHRRLPSGRGVCALATRSASSSPSALND